MYNFQLNLVPVTTSISVRPLDDSAFRCKEVVSRKKEGTTWVGRQENLPINPLITLFLPLEGRHSSVEQMKPLKQDEKKGDRQISTSRLGEIRSPELHLCRSGELRGGLQRKRRPTDGVERYQTIRRYWTDEWVMIASNATDGRVSRVVGRAILGGRVRWPTCKRSDYRRWRPFRSNSIPGRVPVQVVPLLISWLQTKGINQITYFARTTLALHLQ